MWQDPICIRCWTLDAGSVSYSSIYRSATQAGGNHAEAVARLDLYAHPKDGRVEPWNACSRGNHRRLLTEERAAVCLVDETQPRDKHQTVTM
ncbi:unnamed protein product [Protopolystoma xenopodis]|uniref:Uncharacterized protein n=1 Tax=Protopolystoma xenopodis TaxID=117903 RepID=A0A3S5ACL1_9PLAT|nr:unnamed protein product [Protopolystoma xenopodis]